MSENYTKVSNMNTKDVTKNEVENQPLFAQMLPKEMWKNIPGEISCPDIVGSEHKLYIKGVYDVKKGIKGALEMLDWRNHCYVDGLLPAIIVAHDDKLAVYSCD